MKLAGAAPLTLLLLAATPGAALQLGNRLPGRAIRSTAPLAVAPATDDERRALDSRLFSLNVAIVDTVKGLIDIAYKSNPYARFYVLETVARVPYFAYLSVMHLKETFGARDVGLSERMRVHYAEADNELHHLLIMESLGGNSSLVDRTIAQTMAFGYYWYVVLVYSLSEPAAYHLSELIEDHAYKTYDNFLTEYADDLKKQPVPQIARKYYQEDDPFLFDLMYTSKPPTWADGKRPTLETLYDVFVCIRDDEKGHWGTLCNLVQSGSIISASGKDPEATLPIELSDDGQVLPWVADVTSAAKQANALVDKNEKPTARK